MVDSIDMFAAKDADSFSVDRWMKQMQAMEADPKNIDPEVLSAWLYDCTNLFKAMGSAISMAFSGKPRPCNDCADVTGKAAVIHDNKKHMAEVLGCPEASQTIQASIL